MINKAGLQTKINDKTATVAVIGQGYVGLPLALLIAKAGYFVYGIDKDITKISKLKSQISYIDDITNAEVATAISSKKYQPTTALDVIKLADIVIIAVPTPLDEFKVPDLSFITDATETIARHQHPGQLIILESTTYPGTTDEVVLPLLQGKAGKDFYLAFSPERVDPGNKEYQTANTPKVVGGVTPSCTRLATKFYSRVVEKVVPVSSTRVAEMTKLLENIYRVVNISLVNELALLADKMDINIWEVIQAAATKPFGFTPFYPGPGIGGHCIAVDPFYLSYKAREYGFFTRFIDLAGEINELMPHHVVTKVATALNYTIKKAINGSKILIIGVSYKKDIQDTRESAAYKICELLYQKGARLSYFDKYITKFEIRNPKSEKNSKVQISKIQKLTKNILANFDLVLIITDHSNIDYQLIAKSAKVIVDTRNAIKHKKMAKLYQL